MESLGDALIFYTLEANPDHWQFEMDYADRDKTVFTSHHERFRFSRKLFGLHDTPGTFQ